MRLARFPLIVRGRVEVVVVGRLRRHDELGSIVLGDRLIAQIAIQLVDDNKEPHFEHGDDQVEDYQADSNEDRGCNLSSYRPIDTV